jgi:hypothetical protein
MVAIVEKMRTWYANKKQQDWGIAPALHTGIPKQNPLPLETATN